MQFPRPRVGDKLDITMTGAADGGANIKTVFTQIPFKDSLGNTQSGQTYTKYTTVPFMKFYN